VMTQILGESQERLLNLSSGFNVNFGCQQDDKTRCDGRSRHPRGRQRWWPGGVEVEAGGYALCANNDLTM
jgi:hypothetical protein